MILIVDMCYERDCLSADEFVRPVVQVVEKFSDYKIVHYLDIDSKIVSDCEKIILCGVALKDNEYLNYINNFNFLKTIDKPVLGICSGMQVIGLLFGSDLSRSTEIGMTRISLRTPFLGVDSDFDAYCLHNNSVSLPDGFELLAQSESNIQAFKHKIKPVYGVMFHPEVRDQIVIQKFCT